VRLVIKEYEIDYELQKSKSKETGGEDDPYKDNKRRAFIMAIHVNIYTQLMGINTITLLSGTLMDSIYPSLSLYFNLILNSIRLPPTIVATFYVGKKVGRRTLYLWSGVILGLSNYLIAIGFIFNTNFLIITFLFVYMFIFSLLYTPINYAYPAEITPAPKITIANIFNQAAMAVSLLFPPILIQMMNGNGYVVFLFFGIYTTISLIYMYNSLIETKGKKYEEIIKAF
jgi:MFS family permease